MKKSNIYIIKFIFIIFLSFLIYKFVISTNLHQFKAALLRFSPFVIFFALINALISQVFITLRFMNIYKVSFSFYKVICYYFILGISFLFGALSSIGIAPDIYKIYYFKKKSGIKDSISIVLKDKILGFLGLAILGIGYFAYNFQIYYYGSLYFLFPLVIFFCPREEWKIILKAIYYTFISIFFLSETFYLLSNALEYKVKFFNILGGISISLIGRVIPFNLLGINFGTFGIYYFFTTYLQLLPEDALSIVTMSLIYSYTYSLLSLIFYNLFKKKLFCEEI